MVTYRLGARGPEVARLQARLQDLGDYSGPIDGHFGGGTENAVRSFQQRQGLTPDGLVGPQTWERLFPGVGLPLARLEGKPLAYRCLALTGALETGAPFPACFAGLAGDFDGQGLSLGALQWNLGQGTLQPLLGRMARLHPQVLQEVFASHYPELLAVLQTDRPGQLVWARSLQDRQSFRLSEPWRGFFQALGQRPEFQQVQVEFARPLYQAALGLCQEFGLWSERAVALMFDIKVQNGGISRWVKARITQDFARQKTWGSRPEEEVARLRIIARRRAEAAQPRWVEDIRARKLTIAEGQGIVHGRYYHLEGQYAIRLEPFRATG